MTVEIGPQYTQIEYSWTAWKTVCSKKSLRFQYEDQGNRYFIWGYDGPEVHICSIFKTDVPQPFIDIGISQAQNDTDKADFESSYKATGNAPLTQFDIDGATIVRVKAAKRGWSYSSVPIEFQTSKLGSLYSKDASGNNRSYITLKFYNDANQEVTDSFLESTIVKTIVDYEPNFDYEVIGGSLFKTPSIANDTRIWIVAVPDISEAYGGSKEMLGGVNLKFIGGQNLLTIDGRASKMLAYNATYHTNKLRFIAKHPAGVIDSIMICIDIYKS